MWWVDDDDEMMPRLVPRNVQPYGSQDFQKVGSRWNYKLIRPKEIMLPTPSTDHVSFDRVYEPAEDSYLLLDTLSSETEKTFLRDRFCQTPDSPLANSPSPLIVEIGSGSGVVLSFVHAHAETIFGRADILTAGVDVNLHACKATIETVSVAGKEQDGLEKSHGCYLGNISADLTTALKIREVDVLIFNPPYVPTPDLPALIHEENLSSYDTDSHLLSLSYAGGEDGMEVTNRLLAALPEVLSSQRGVAFILLCAQNKPELVKKEIRAWGNEWKVETVGSSGKKAGWEKLQILRIYRASSSITNQ
ncbi:S-adenosyl-L-methionine-dependent methyltransferase [Glarea lozoyensis ATCC 20868]|uniref:S-adenosyl-L-methionine-dependent methyltransferase n=1 Tax=Glarea lozoyensis (strain ATCC 20868 / MF5171) TaxID=1116229 RepID=S3CJV9_GLAL2|nr:S-adenosyl-L-methionine-dependent methyltransferase [Glarea lozoyensis ATCC 20868]EPE26777.1 S-adenosyl-L-methionine-dependent methyltransferase [Glarea lozoyensis ATCC 20868]